MNLAKIIEIDLIRRSASVQIGESAVVGDSRSRSLTFRLTADGAPWNVPDGVRAAVAFRTDDGSSGEYDQMPDGTDAFLIDGNKVTVRLIDRIMAKAGPVTLMLVLRDGSLRQLSTFPILMEVSEGIAGAEELPEQYYRVRDLEQVNAELERILAKLDAIDTDAIFQASAEARAAAEEAKQAALSVNADEIARAIAGKGDDVYVEDGRLYLLSAGNIIGDGVALPGGGAGLAFDSGYVDGANLLHLTLDGADIKGFTPFVIPAGGGGDASAMALTTSLESLSFSILERDEECVIPFNWSSTASGVSADGFAEWTVNGSRVALVSVKQGENSFDVRKYLTAGSENTVVLKVTDIYGNMRSLSFFITVTSYSLSWNLGETGVYEGAELVVRLTPMGSGEKVVKVSVNDKVISETSVTTTGRTFSVTVPAQEHGAHAVKAWMEVPTDSEALITEPLVHVGAWLSPGIDFPVIGILTPEVTVGQYGTAAIRYFVVDPVTGAPDHIGIAAGVQDGQILVIEGNYDNAVKLRKLTIDGQPIRGFVCPRYDTLAKEEEMERYHTIGEVPAYARGTIEKLTEDGSLRGIAEDDLGLTEELVRILVILDRRGLL